MSTKVGLNRASLFALKKEVSSGEYAKPLEGKDYLPLRPGNELSYEPEQLENDEMLNDIGASKSATGKEVVTGSHSAYLRHSGTEGQEPQLGLLFESVMGTKKIADVEDSTLADSTTSVIKVADGSIHVEGEALLIKDPVNGYAIRNIKRIDGNDLHLAFDLNAAPAAGVELGKAITYLPSAQGHPSFSTTKFLGNGYAKECSAGNTVTDLSITADANGFGELEFSYEGTRYLFNPIVVDATNKFIDVEDDSGVYAVSVPERVYRTPIELADALAAAFGDDFRVEYNSRTGKFVIDSLSSTTLSLLWVSGANAADSIGDTLKFDTSADATGSLVYESADEMDYSAEHTPSYDSGDAIVIKGANLMIGNEKDNIDIHAQSVSVNITKETEDVDSIIEQSGIHDKVATSRSAEMEVTAILKKHDATLLDALLKNSDVGAMLNAGPRAGGNYVPGKCFNVYLQTATVSQYTTQGDAFIQVQMTLSGFVTSSTKDIFVNFV